MPTPSGWDRSCAAASRHPGDRRTAARRRPRGPLGLARLPLRRDPFGQEPLVVHRRGSGRPDHRGAKGTAGADHRCDLRRPREHSQRRQAGAEGRAAPTLSVPLSSRGGQADLRGRSSCQEGTEEAGAGHPSDRGQAQNRRRRRQSRTRTTRSRTSCGATAPRCAPP